MFRELLTQKQNYALILLLLALLSYSLIGFSLDVSANEPATEPREGMDQPVARSSDPTAANTLPLPSLSPIAFSRR